MENEMHLSKTYIESFQGDVVPLWLEADEELLEASSGEVSWQLSGRSVRIRRFCSDEPEPISYGVLLMMRDVGESTICAEYKNQRLFCTVVVREKRTADPHRNMKYLLGDLHIHTTNEHDSARFRARTEELPGACIRDIEDTKALDFAVLADHGSLMDGKKLFEAFQAVEKAETEHTILFAGCEASLDEAQYDRYGFRKKYFGEIVTLNSAHCIAAMYTEDFCDTLSQSPFPMAVLAHPQILGHAPGWGMWVSALRQNATPAMKRLVRSVEMGNGTDRQSNLINEYVYSVALDCGFQVTPSCNSDSHGNYKLCPGKTIVLAPEKSKEMILDALYHNRAYACESGRVLLDFTINGQPIASTLPETTAYHFRVGIQLLNMAACAVDEAASDALPVLCQVISDYGKTVAHVKLTSEAQHTDGTVLEFDVESQTARYFYLRLVDAKGRKTWSAPIWTGRAMDTISLEAPGEVIEKANFGAVDLVNGQNAGNVICDDIQLAYESDCKTAEIRIDMKQEYEICAISHIVPKIYRALLTEQGVAQQDEFSRYVHEFRIWSSVDGEQYELCTEGIARIYGEEELYRFEPRRSRYVKFEVVNTVGSVCGWKQYAEATVKLGELSVYRVR
ncbi:MAG: hypothetical protein E7286_11610 [Lachnospiraceae bacterium]|nr:hypothetical protein [Lachnospiraceae bacterium]